MLRRVSIIEDQCYGRFRTSATNVMAGFEQKGPMLWQLSNMGGPMLWQVSNIPGLGDQCYAKFRTSGAGGTNVMAGFEHPGAVETNVMAGFEHPGLGGPML